MTARTDRPGLLEGLRRVRSSIEAAALRAGTDPATIRLVAVTKGFAWEQIEPLAEALSDVGENRVQELLAKQEQARAYPSLVWHMIGTLQRNKVADVVGRVVLIHSVDSGTLAAAIDARARALAVIQDVLIQVNASGETSKHGVDLGDAIDLANDVEAMSGMRLRGLMTIAAPGDPAGAREAFARTRQVRDRIAETHPGATELSMGMSSDFEDAIGAGATIVRVGSAIFGPRPSSNARPGSPDTR